MIYKNITRVCLWLALLLVFVGCGTKDQTPYSILDSNYSAHKDNFWLDNNSVIFHGSSGSKPKTVEEKARGKGAIYLWETKTNTVSKYAEGKGLCYSNGDVFYWLPEDSGRPKTLIWKEGKYGAEKEYNRPYRSKEEQRKWRQQYIRSRISCREIKRPSGMQGHKWFPLLEEHGYLDYGVEYGKPPVDQKPLVFHSKEAGRAIELPIGRYEAQRIRYYVFKSAYLILQPGGLYDPKRIKSNEKCGKAWWLSGDGEIIEECIPAHGLARGELSDFYPIRNGLLGIGGGFISPTDPGDAGLYLISGTKALKLISGLINGVAISPDGCKVAFAHAPHVEALRVGRPGRRTLKMINLCK